MKVFYEYVEDGSTHSSIHVPRGILWYILLGPHHDQLATYQLSHREMVARDTRFVPVREMTIMLQDVAIILGLRMNGAVVTGTCVFNVAKLCRELLGVTPPPDTDEVTLERSVRCFIITLM